MFEIRPTKNYGLTNEDLFKTSGETPVLTNTSINNGITGYVNLSPTEKGNVITFSDTTTSDGIFYQPDDFIGYSHIQVLIPLKYKKIYNYKIYLYILSCFKKATAGLYSYGSKFNRKNAGKTKIQLPITPDNTPNFEYMEQYITCIQNLHVTKIKNYLNAYLFVTKLDDYTLNENDKNILSHKPSWGKFEIGDLFEKIPTTRLPYKAFELKNKSDDVYNLPALTAGVDNQGLAYYAPRDGATILKNVISVSANGANSGAMFYQSHEFTVLQDSFAMAYKGFSPNASQYLFLLTALQKVIRYNFDWTNKAGWNRIKDIEFSLPILSNGEPDFDYMEKYIQTQQKLIISKVIYNNWSDQ